MTRLPLVILLPLLLAGCGSSTGTLSGAVTLDGEPLKHGAVRVVPDDEHAAARGGLIEGGRYEVKDLKPGRYKIHVNGAVGGMLPPGAGPAGPTPDPVGGATGNDPPVEVAGGEQTHDVTLTSPAGAGKK